MKTNKIFMALLFLLCVLFNSIAHARYYDAETGRFMSVDPVEFKPDNVHSFNRYAYANNNPYKYVDPDGRAAALIIDMGIPLTLGTIYYITRPPAEQRALANAFKRTFDNIIRSDSETTQSNTSNNIPPVPGEIVGDQSDPKAGPNKNGGKHTSGPLRPEHGGTGDYDTDLNKLTGGTRPWKPGDKAPPGSQVGSNGIFGRPQNSSGGQSIDIPGNNDKPHETLHYPPP